MLAAMIPLSTKVGLYPTNSVLVHGVKFDTSKQCYIVHCREWKHEKYLSHFLKEDSLNRTTISKYFTSTLTVELTKVKFVYINPMSEYEPSSDRKFKPTVIHCNFI